MEKETIWVKVMGIKFHLISTGTYTLIRALKTKMFIQKYFLKHQKVMLLSRTITISSSHPRVAGGGIKTHHLKNQKVYAM